jgi:glutamate dehydrogenase/leucine dehydrogenase
MTWKYINNISCGGGKGGIIVIPTDVRKRIRR